MARMSGWVVVLASLALTGCQGVRGPALVPERGDTPSSQTAQDFTRQVSKTMHYMYWLYLPKGYGTGHDRWPLLLFLHGAGERGHDLRMLKVHGPPRLVESGRDLPMIIVSPQCPAGQWWDSEALNALLDEVVARYAVDETRVYATGLSMGGYGTWLLASMYPDRFAAIVPICGGGIGFLAQERLKHVPAWVFHGGRDQVVPLLESVRMVDALRKAGDEFKFTIYPEAGHDAWSETYRNPEVYEWLLSHRKR